MYVCIISSHVYYIFGQENNEMERLNGRDTEQKFKSVIHMYNAK